MLFLNRFARKTRAFFLDESGEMDEKVVMMVGIIIVAAAVWKRLGAKIVELVDRVIAGMG